MYAITWQLHIKAANTFPANHKAMPFVQVAEDVRIYYHVYTNSNAPPSKQDAGIAACENGHPRRILLIMGLGASFVCWKPQIFSLLSHSMRYGDVEVCTLDNRGLGLSSAPPANSANYSTRCAQPHTTTH